MNISKRIQEMSESPMRRLIPFANEAKRNGKKVFHLNIGQPDLETPQVFFDAIAKHKSSTVKYTSSNGTTELVNSLIKYFKRDGIDFKEEEILITNGASEALSFILKTICDPGDEILVPEPFYPNYKAYIKESSVKIKPITTLSEHGYHLPKRSVIENLITDKTKGILFSNPGNPTGVVYTDEELDMIASIAKDNNLYIISDEVYRGLSFDGLVSKSMGTLKGIDQNLIITESISKRFSACGARIGSIQTKNINLIKQIRKLCQARLSVAELEQIGAAALFALGNDYIEASASEYQKRRDVVFNALSDVPGVSFKKPKGALYAFIRLPIEDAEDFVIWLLKDFDINGETVMITPGEGFYQTPGSGKDEVRVAFVLNEEDMKKSLNIFKLGLEKYISIQNKK